MAGHVGGHLCGCLDRYLACRARQPGLGSIHRFRIFLDDHDYELGSSLKGRLLYYNALFIEPSSPSYVSFLGYYDQLRKINVAGLKQCRTCHTFDSVNMPDRCRWLPNQATS